MGMYTGLRFKGIVKPEYREMIKEINDGADWNDFTEKFPFLTDYANQDRAEFIPRGSLAYMPDTWEEGEFPDQMSTDGFERSINLETGYWTFQCSLKNYNQEIEQFINEVLPKIIDSAEHIEYFYEEWARSIFYELKDEKIVDSDRKGILYGYEGEENNYWGY
ncbi:hypothetical protein AAHH67_15635 [Niallia circulans]